jgi:two-component system, OmpR family, response regulator CpxR
LPKSTAKKQEFFQVYILIIEDSFEIREMLTLLLEEEGYDTVAMANGQEALDFLRESHQLPCLILLDLMMPIMDGSIFGHEQQQDSALSQIPVVVVSATLNAKQVASSIHATAYLQKPIDFEALLDVVRGHCARG